MIENNSSKALGFFLLLLTLVIGAITSYRIATSNKTEKNYIHSAFPGALHMYENVVTEEDNDFFVTQNVDGEEITYLVTVTNNGTAHHAEEVTEETETLHEMMKTSLATDHRP